MNRSKSFFPLLQRFTSLQTLEGHSRPCVYLYNSKRHASGATAAQGKKEPTLSSSYMKNIFRGQLQANDIFPFPQVLDNDQSTNLEMLVDPVSKFFEEVNDPFKNDELSEVEEHTVEGLKSLGAFGLQVPEALGGVGLNNTQYARLVEIVGQHDLGVGIFLGAHQSIGFKGILLYGNPEQKAKYLPVLASGEKYAAFCLTEPTAGSDANSVRTNAVLSEDGTHYILNGSKLWSSNGGIADVFTVFAQTEVKNPKTGATEKKVSAFIVERHFAGVSSGPPEKKMGIKCSNTAEVYFEDVHVPVENLIGEPGQGFKIAMGILNNGRFGMIAALAGTIKGVIQKAADHAGQRKQFGHSISDYGAIQEKMAKMAMKHYVTESMAYMVAANMDKGITEIEVESAIGKVYGSEAAWYCVDEAIQVLGGMGYMKECGLERVMRDLRIFRIFEGTNDILRLLIAGYGLKYAGGFLQSMGSSPGKMLEFGARQMKKNLGMSSGISLTPYVHPALKGPAEKVADRIGMFSYVAEDFIMQYKKRVATDPKLQFQMNRLADSAIEIYACTAILSRASKALYSNSESAEHEAKLVSAYCDLAVHQIDSSLRQMKPEFKSCFETMSSISEDIVKEGGVVPQHILGF